MYQWNTARRLERISEGTQPEFPFSNSGDTPGTPTDSKKKQTFHLT